MLTDFFYAHKGELAALVTAFFWTITAVAFESAGKKIGSLSVNLIRLLLAFIFLGLLNWVLKGQPLPLNASAHNWIWLSLSGLVGFVIGDLMLFQAYVVVGARISMLIVALAPPIAALIGWLALAETMTIKQLLAMALIFAGIAMVILQKESDDVKSSQRGNKKLKLSYPIGGLLLAFGGAVGQGGGLVLSKIGLADYDVFQAVQIRIVVGLVGFSLIFTFSRRWNSFRKALTHKKALAGVSIGAFFGPFLGVSFSLLAVKYTTAGVASALMSIVPVLIIPFSVYFLNEKFKPKELFGALFTVVGVFMFFF